MIKKYSYCEIRLFLFIIMLFWIIFNSNIASIVYHNWKKKRVSDCPTPNSLFPPTPNSRAEKQVPYFAITGTLLGAMRCGNKKGRGLFFKWLLGSKKTPTLLVPVYERISFHICILWYLGYVQGIFWDSRWWSNKDFRNLGKWSQFDHLILFKRVPQPPMKLFSGRMV